MGRVLGVGSDLGVGVARGVAVGVGVAVAAAVAVGVAVAVAVAVTVGVAVGLGDGVPHDWYRITSSTYMAVSSPNPSWCTRNFMRTVCPANGAMFIVVFIQVCPFSH